MCSLVCVYVAVVVRLWPLVQVALFQSVCLSKPLPSDWALVFGERDKSSRHKFENSEQKQTVFKSRLEKLGKHWKQWKPFASFVVFLPWEGLSQCSRQARSECSDARSAWLKRLPPLEGRRILEAIRSLDHWFFFSWSRNWNLEKIFEKSQKQKHMKTLHEKGSSETEKGNYKDSEKTSNAINMARMTSQKIDKMLHSRIACIKHHKASAWHSKEPGIDFYRKQTPVLFSLNDFLL